MFNLTPSSLYLPSMCVLLCIYPNETYVYVTHFNSRFDRDIWNYFKKRTLAYGRFFYVLLCCAKKPKAFRQNKCLIDGLNEKRPSCISNPWFWMASNRTESEPKSMASTANSQPLQGSTERENQISWTPFVSFSEFQIWARYGANAEHSQYLKKQNIWKKKCNFCVDTKHCELLTSNICVIVFQVRATSLQELVYKNGQAGITKASVTIIFDNTDEDNCPVGYEKCKEISVTRQVVVGGKNKYWINGKIVLNKKVTDLFCSVQMNVNNPNFLIMQGRITKVLNMKPMEVWYFWPKYMTANCL